jgi:quercetin dioxygenase-like cupin family protein
MDTTVKKIDAANSPKGEMGQTYLASGKRVSMRLWDREAPSTEETPHHTRSYETVGYVIAGKAKLHVGPQVVTLNPGDSWVVPADAEHRYEIVETFTAVEATSPPARVDERDASA